MEVKPGYKQTEVGVIPEEWRVLPITSLLQRGSRITYGVVKPGPSPADGVLFIRGGDVCDGRILTDQLRTISHEVSDQYKRTRLSGGEIVVSLVGYPGEVARVPTWLAGANIARQVALIRLDSTQPLSGDFVCRFLQSNTGRRLLLKESIGSAQQVINLRDITRVVLVLPSEAEQRAIAEALSDVDGLLGGLNRLIAKKRDLKQAAMQQLLTGQTRLPGFHGEWKLAKLRQFVTADRFAIVDGPFGSQLKVDEYVESGVPVIEMEHLDDGVITSDLARCITPQKLNDLKRSAVYPGDILISKTGSLGKLGILPATIERGLITSRLAKITLDPTKAVRRFVFQFLLKLRRDGYWEQVSQGGTMQILGIGMLQNAPVPDIAPAEQTAIAEVLTEMDLELAELEQRREKTCALKQAMMQELLTGRMRLI